MICGLLKPTAGEGTCLGYDILRESEAIKREVGYMTQRFSFYEDLTIRENLEFVARLYELPNLRQTVDATLEGLGLKSRQHQLAGTLSGGWKQRLALAACIMHKPKLLLLDEPTAGVDPKARREFWDEIHRLAEDGLTVLVSTHYMDEAERCHRIVYIAYGTHRRARHVGGDHRGIRARHLRRLGPRRIGAAARALHGMPGVEQVAAFGEDLHVVGSDREALERERRARSPRRFDVKVAPGETTLEDVFIRLMSEAQAAGGGMMTRRASARQRIRAILLKEVIQMRRDRLTFAMIVGIPIIQLVLFGYAINTDPKRLPTGDRRRRSRVRSRARSSPACRPRTISHRRATHPKRRRAKASPTARSPSSSPCRAISTRDLARGRDAQIVVEADATDPVRHRQRRRRHAGDRAPRRRRVARRAARRRTSPAKPARRSSSTGSTIRKAITAYNIVPGLIGMILTMTTTLMTALALTREIERGTMENLLAMPVRPVEIMIGKIVPYIGLGLLQVAGHPRPPPSCSSPCRWRARSGCSSSRSAPLHRRQRDARLHLLHARPHADAGDADDVLLSSCRRSCSPASCSRSAACRSGRR